MLKCTCPQYWLQYERDRQLANDPCNDYKGALSHCYFCPKRIAVRCVRCGMTPDETHFGSYGKIDCHAFITPMKHDFKEDPFGFGR